MPWHWIYVIHLSVENKGILIWIQVLFLNVWNLPNGCDLNECFKYVRLGLDVQR